MSDLLGLRYIATGVPIEQIDKNIKPGDVNFIARTKDAYVYEYPNALAARATASLRVARRFREDDHRGRVAGSRFSRGRAARGIADLPQANADQKPATARIVSYENTEVVIEAEAPRGAAGLC